MTEALKRKKLFLFFFVVTAIFCFFEVFGEIAFLARSQPMQGTIIEIIPRNGWQLRFVPTTYFDANLTYDSTTGQELRFEKALTTSARGRDISIAESQMLIGDKVDLPINPRLPDEVQVRSFRGCWSKTLGLSLLTIFLFFFWYGLPRRKHSYTGFL